MKPLFIAAVLAVAAFPALAADARVSINIGQPGFYGPIDIGGLPPPKLIYSAPRALYQSALQRPPIYMNVPPGHAKDWRKHCRHYNACGERVYFVQNSWYEREYVPHFQKRQGDRRDNDRDDHRGKQNDNQGKDQGKGRGH